jgi:hypothetical protein
MGLPRSIHSRIGLLASTKVELYQSIEWIIIIIMTRSSIYFVLNYEVVVDIYQLMELHVGQLVWNNWTFATMQLQISET